MNRRGFLRNLVAGAAFSFLGAQAELVLPKRRDPPFSVGIRWDYDVAVVSSADVRVLRGYRPGEVAEITAAVFPLDDSEPAFPGRPVVVDEDAGDAVLFHSKPENIQWSNFKKFT